MMKRGFPVALVAAGCLMAATQLSAQAPASQTTPADASQKPAATPPKPAESNPFPVDTNNIPVMPSKDTPALPEGTYNGADSERVKLPRADLDPVRSPDDAATEDDSAQPMDSSSSSAGLDKIVPGPDDDSQPQRKRRKLAVPEPEHHETSAEDIDVGKYELDNKNWKAALSRFESAMVLAPDEPDVYWGLAECERHLGHFADARAYYQKVALYDPDSKHGKEAMKALKEPEIANAKAASPAPPAK
jgi:Tetratricopeptide repeat